MLVRDPEVLSLVERLREHYRTNIANRYIRPALLVLPLDRLAWEQIENLTETTEEVNYQGHHLDELYRQLAVFAHFVSLSKHELSPMLRIRLGSLGQKHSDDRVLREMAISNFLSNINILAEIINDLYASLIRYDEKVSGKAGPLYRRIPELKDFSRLIVD